MAAHSRNPPLSQAVLKYRGRNRADIGSDGLKFDDLICTSFRLSHLEALLKIRPLYLCDSMSRQ